MRLLICPDKFRGTVTAPQAAAALAAGAVSAGFASDGVVQLPMADGGEGTLDALGGANRETRVVGPLGELVTAGWRLDGTRAVVETAQAAGLTLAGGATENQPLVATTTGVGQLIVAVCEAGARRVIVGVGGSATTDGGAGALAAMEPLEQFCDTAGGPELVVACDVDTTFLDAARIFGPQKGATEAQVAQLTQRLTEQAATYQQRFGVDVTQLPGSGAAGGLAGGLAAVGARLVDGFDLVADELGLVEQLRAADLVVTGEGKLDATSLNAKVPGGVARLCRQHSTDLLVVAGTVEGNAGDGSTPDGDPSYSSLIKGRAVAGNTVDDRVIDYAHQLRGDGTHQVRVLSLVELFGTYRAFNQTAAALSEAVAGHLAAA